MKPALAGLLLLALGCTGGAEVPPLEIGGSSGTRLMNGQPKTPFDAYDLAYAQMTKQHLNVRRGLDPRTKSLSAAEEALDAIIRALETMQALVGPKDQPKFDPYLVNYRAWRGAVENDTWGGSFLSDFEASEREIKSRFNPGNVEMVSEFPASMKKGNPPAAPLSGVPPKRAPAAEIPDDRVQAPPKRITSPSDPPATSKAQETRTAFPLDDPGVSYGLLFSAWDRTHELLLESYKAKKDCRARFDRLMEALKLMKARLAQDRAAKLQIYIDYYGAISEKTKSFTTLPEKTAEKDIVDELEVAARVLRKEFNPDP